jgi:branched-chain amino acid transport system substrate-binding protein
MGERSLRWSMASWGSAPLRGLAIGVLAAGGLSGLVGQTAGAATTSPGVTSKTITIGMINDTTGIASSTFADGVGGARARIALQNAEGGVDGRKLKLVVQDDQSNPTLVKTEAQALVENDDVFGIVADSAFTYGAAPYLTSAGVPVTGDTFDGPEWGNSPNMFSYGAPTYTSYNGASYSYNNVSKLLKMIGVTKVAVLTDSIPDSAVLSANQLVETDTKLGIQNCFYDASVPFGSTDFTTAVLQIKQAGCNGVVGTFVESQDVGLATALQNAGLHLKQVYYTSYSQATLGSSAIESALSGTYTEGVAAAGHSTTAAATKKFYAALKKYDPVYTGGIPDLGLSNSWDAADTMIEGLKLAGPNPTRATFIKKLRVVKDYTLGGLSASPVSFNYLTGHLPTQECVDALEFTGKKFVPYPADGAPVCGSLVAYKGGS